jgi:hypothetical protein
VNCIGRVAQNCRRMQPRIKKWLVRYNAAMALPVSERHAPALLNDPRSRAFSRYSSRSDVAEKFVNFGP